MGLIYFALMTALVGSRGCWGSKGVPLLWSGRGWMESMCLKGDFDCLGLSKLAGLVELAASNDMSDLDGLAELDGLDG